MEELKNVFGSGNPLKTGKRRLQRNDEQKQTFKECYLFN